MSNLYWLTETQMERIRPYFPKSRGRARVDDKRVLSGIIFINRNGLRWCDAPAEYGRPKTLYNRWKRWSDMGIFAQILMGLAEQAPDNKTLSIDATYLKAHRTASSLRLKRGVWTPDPLPGRVLRSNVPRGGLTKGGMNTKLHAVSPSHGLQANHCRAVDTSGRPIRLFITAGQVSDYTGAAALMNGLPEAEWLLADRGYDADWFRETLVDKGTKPCIPGRKSRKKPIKYPFRDIAVQCTDGQWTSAVTNDVTASKGCSADSRIGDASQPATTDHRPYSFPPLLSPQQSYSSYES